MIKSITEQQGDTSMSSRPVTVSESVLVCAPVSQKNIMMTHRWEATVHPASFVIPSIY
eukprot:m.410162 g.410162  ORF g.410162 m.410162 type:complete len:58 (-) comp16806_c1_seq30:747-920(-)